MSNRHNDLVAFLSLNNMMTVGSGMRASSFTSYLLNGSPEKAQIMHDVRVSSVSFSDTKVVPDKLFGVCISFERQSGISIPNPFPNNTQFTISGWLKPDAAMFFERNVGEDQYFGFAGSFHSFDPPGGNDDRQSGLYFYKKAGENGKASLVFNLFGRGDAGDPAPKISTGAKDEFFVAPDQWVHFAWVKEGARSRLYRNGVLVDSRETLPEFDERGAYCWVGHAPHISGEFHGWMGAMANMRIYKRPLSDGEISEDFRLDQNRMLHYFPLDGVFQDEGNFVVHNVAQDHQKGKLFGTSTSVVANDETGFSLPFNGTDTYVEVLDAGVYETQFPQLSMAVWVRPEKSATGSTIIGSTVKTPTPFRGVTDTNVLDFLTQTGQAVTTTPFGVVIDTNGLVNVNTHFYISGADETYLGSTRFKTPLKWDVWQHLAIVFNQQEFTLVMLLDGKIVDTVTVFGGEHLLFSNFWIGRSAHDGWGPFQGQMAHLRVYKRALTQAEVSGRIMDDMTAAAAHRRSHPLEFQLLDADDQNALYITSDGKMQELALHITNTSDRVVEFPTANDHFTLSFRSGVLSEATLGQIAPRKDSGWTMKDRPVFTSSRGPVVRFSFAAPASGSLAPGEVLVLPLTGMSAAPMGGHRSTLVEVAYRNIKYSDSTGETLEGSHLVNLNIINHKGLKNIPLHAGFHGSNRVLTNNGHNKLTLYISSIATDGAILWSKDAAEPTRFILSFDPTDVDWKMADSIATIKVRVNGKEISSVDGKQEQWAISGTDALGEKLDAGGSLKIEITEIPVNGLPGQTNLYLHYENVPGYWDGQFVLPIEKGPVMIFEDGKVGIGTTTPDTALTIKGVPSGGGTPQWLSLQTVDGKTQWHLNYLDTGLNFAKTLVRDGAFFIGDNLNVGIGTTRPAARLDINQPSGLALRVEPDPAKTVYIGRGGGNSLEFDYAYGQALNSTANLSFSMDSNNDDTGRYIDFKKGSGGFTGGSLLLRIQQNGNVGIGTGDPQARLHVAGDLRVDGLLQVKGMPGLLFGEPIRPIDNGTINIEGLDLDGHKMYMLVVKLNNPNSQNEDYKLFFNNDRSEARYYGTYTQQFGGATNVKTQQNAVFANAGQRAQHVFTMYITRSGSGNVVAYGQGGFETPGAGETWGYQLWHFFLTYRQPGNVTKITISGSRPPFGFIGAGSEVLIYRMY